MEDNCIFCSFVCSVRGSLYVFLTIYICLRSQTVEELAPPCTVLKNFLSKNSLYLVVWVVSSQPALVRKNN